MLERIIRLSPIIMIASLIFAGTDGTIRGIVTDNKNNPLPGATIQIPDLGIGTMADIDGNYIL